MAHESAEPRPEPEPANEEMDLATTPAAQLMRAQVEREVEKHGVTWCSPNCRFFPQRAYRERRLVKGEPREKVQQEICASMRGTRL